MADQKISELTALTGANLADVDAFAVVDTSEVQTKKITYAELKTALDTGTGFVRITGDTMTGNLLFGDSVQAQFGDSQDLRIYHDNTHSYIQDAGSGQLKFKTNGAAVQIIDGSNSLMINAQTGSSVDLYHSGVLKLSTTSSGISVTGNIIGSDELQLLQPNGTNNFGMELNNSHQIKYKARGSGGTHIFTNTTSDTELLRIDSGGSVLIGTTTPTDLHNTWTHVMLGDKGSLISQNGSGGIAGTFITDNVYIDSDTGSYAYVTTDQASLLQQEGGEFIFKQAASGSAGAAISFSEAMRIDSSGNLLVGKTADDFGTVGTAISQLGEIQTTRASATPLYVRRNTNEGELIGFYNDNTAVGSIGVRASDNLYINSPHNGIEFTNSDFRPIDGNGDRTNGVSDIGDADNRFKDLHLSGTANTYRMNAVTGSSGASAHANADEIVAESNANAGISILSGQSYSGFLHFGDAGVSNDGFIEYYQGDRSMRFGTGDGERARLDASGTLFLSTTTPTLHSSMTGIVLDNGSLLNETARGASKSLTLAQNLAVDSGNTWAYLSTDEGSYYQQFNGNHYFGTAPSGTAGADATVTSKLTILNGGNVGIGTTSNPEYQLEVFKATGNLAKITTTDDNNGATNPLHIAYNASLRVDNAWSGAGPSAHGTKVAKIQLGTVTTNGYGAYGAIILDSHGTGYDTAEMSFATGSNSSSLMTERMRIDSSGNVGIGTASPNGNGLLTINTPTNNSPQIVFSENNTAKWLIGHRHDGDHFRFYDLANSTERMRIDSSGRVGIGTTSPDSYNSSADDLVVGSSGSSGITVVSGTSNSGNLFFADGTSGNQQYRGFVQYQHSDDRLVLGAAGDDQVWIYDNAVAIGGSDAWHRLQITGSGTTDGSIFLHNDNDTDHQYNGIIFKSDSTNTNVRKKAGIFFERTAIRGQGILHFCVEPSNSDTNASLSHSVFNTNGDHLRIKCTATPSASVSGFLFSSDQLYTSAGNTTNTNTQVRFYNGNGLVGSISTAGSGTAYATSSDYRLKENVSDMTGATARLKQLKPKRFNWIADSDNTIQDGFLAHEVSSIVPEAVLGTKDAEIQENGDGYQSLDYSRLVPLLVKTIQELEARITALEA